MKNVPQMIDDIIKKEDLKCDKCNGSFKRKHLSLVGIMDSVVEKDRREVLTIGLSCKKCQELAIFEIKDMDLEELSVMVRKEISTKKGR